MPDVDDYRSKTPPPEHPDWQPAGKRGHYCVGDRFCQCGHWSRRVGSNAVSGVTRGRVNLDVIEQNEDNR